MGIFSSKQSGCPPTPAPEIQIKEVIHYIQGDDQELQHGLNVEIERVTKLLKTLKLPST